MKNLKMVGVVLLTIGGTWAVQMYALKETKARLAALEARVADMQPGSFEPSGVERSSVMGGIEPADTGRRIARLESLLSKATHGTNGASAAGRTGLTTHRIDELRRKLADPTASEKDKLQALHALRKSKDLSDEVLQSALSWLQSSKDGAMRREILQQLDGVTNAALRQPLLELAASSAEGRVRQQAVENLRGFVADAGVEKQLWETMQKDPDPKVREQAQEALRKGPMTPDRAAGLQERVADAQVPLDERLTALTWRTPRRRSRSSRRRLRTW
jgi:hypothetical protein